MDKERPYQNLDRDALLRVLDHVPKDAVKLAVIYENYLQAKEKRGDLRYWEDRYLQTLEKSIYFGEFPRHKIEWCLDAVDIIAGSLLEAGDLDKREMAAIVALSGLFEKRHENKSALKRYKNPRNWETYSAYGNTLRSRYIGDRELHRIVNDYSHFDYNDFYKLVDVMTSAGDIMEDPTTHGLRLTRT